jgi:hypothetical protein
VKLLGPKSRALLAVFLAVAVVCFAFQAAGHWHSNSYEDQHCRVCHFAHSAAADLSQVTALVIPAVVQRLSSNLDIDPALDVIFHQLSSRAPPA